MSEPVPTSQPKCWTRRFLPVSILFHPWDDDLEAWTDKNGSSLQCLLSRQRARRHEGFFRILQLSLARRTSLKVDISLKPNPPSFFGFAIFFYEIQDIFLLSCAVSHQNRVSSDWIWSQRVCGSLKHDIACDGIAERTDRSITIFPARERNFEDQLMVLRFIRSTIYYSINHSQRFDMPTSSITCHVFFVYTYTVCDIKVCICMYIWHI